MGCTRSLISVFILLVEESVCFNLDVNFIDLIGIGSDTQYFGYSVLLQKGGSGSVLVGAPKSNSTYANHASINEPGVVYKCEIGIPNDCKQYVIDREGNSEYRGGDNRYNFKNRKDKGLLGATIDGGENSGDPLFVCSPKWVNDRTDRNGQHYLANGMCYHLRDSGNVNEVGEKIMPLLHAGKQSYAIDAKVKYYYAVGETGMSIQYLSNEKELLLGAPGVLSWKGTVVRYKTSYTSNLPIQQRLIQQRQKRQIRGQINVPNPIYIPSLKEDNSYFGYAISSGRFLAKQPDLWYVTGAPRAEDLHGLVLLYEFSQYDDADLIIHKKLVGDQLGAYFGAALLSTDVTGDQTADLLIGAPTYLSETWDEGCVYFYKNDGQGSFENPLKIFGSKQTGARFGTALSSIGDINQDSYEDVAVAAPYEDNQGAVYIYLGGKSGLNMEFNQKIAAKLIDSSVRGFGFSISKGTDIDQNYYNDIAIGAYRSGHVAIVKSRPVIKYYAKLMSSMRELSIETTAFNVTYCLGFMSTTNTINRVDTNIEIIKDFRTMGNSKIAQTLTLKKENDYCDNIRIVLKNGNLDYAKPLTFDMLYSPADISQTEFCSSCPVTDPADSKSVMLSVPFANGCGDDNICQPDLKIFVSFENNLNSLVIGSSTTLKLNVRVENEGEPAYLCQVHMKLPSSVEIFRLSSRCELSEDRTYHCLADNVLQPNSYKEMVFELDIKKLNPKDTQLLLNLTTDSKGEEVNVFDNTFLAVLPLHLESNVEIAGKSFPAQIAYVDENNEVKFKIVSFTHEFSIKNFGPSPLPSIAIDFHFPVQLDSSENIAFAVYHPEVFVDNQAVQCITAYNLGFFSESIDGAASNIDEEHSGTRINRIKRSNPQTETDIHHFEQISSPNVFFDLPLNRTVFVNCSSSNIKCMKVTCASEEVLNHNQHISAKFSLRAHIDVLEQILEKKDIILVSSTAEATVNGKILKNYINTLLIGSLTKEEVSYWIYIVCVIVALVILAVVIFVLYKLNFFNRPVREKLQNVSEGLSTKKEVTSSDHDDDEKYSS